MPFAATWMELETLILSEVSQKEKDKYHMISYIWNLIYGTNEPFHRKENHRLEESFLKCSLQTKVHDQTASLGNSTKPSKKNLYPSFLNYCKKLRGGNTSKFIL